MNRDEAIWHEHREWGERLAARVTPLAPADTSADPDRPLVIGYLSPDFREHAVARFFEPLLAAHDRRRHQLPLDGGPQLALVYRLFDERPRVVVVLAVAAKGQRDL